MRPDEFKFLYELEQNHWWFVGMRRVVASLLDGVVPVGPLRILDAGCGSGFMLGWLRRYGTGPVVYGLDYDSEALRYSARRGEKYLARGTVAALPFATASFDLVTSFDVLYTFTELEVKEPFAELARVTKRDGLVLVRVPAFQFLYSQHDRAVDTQHRYTVGELRARLEEQGLKVVRVTYANSILFPVVVVWRWLTRSDRPDPQSDVRPLPKPLRWLNPLLGGLFAFEAAWLKYLPFRLAVGTSAIALARKP